MNIYRALRMVIVSLLSAAVLLFAALYIVLSIPSVHDRIRHIGEDELSKLTGADVKIGRVTISPFHDLVLQDVFVPDLQGDSLLYVKELGAGISIYNLMMNRRVVFTYGEILGMKGAIRRPDKQSPTNIQFLIDAFSSKDKKKPPTKFDIKIYNLVIRQSELTYDVDSEPRHSGRFDANHIGVRNLRADVALPRMKNNDFMVDVKRISFDEISGVQVKNLATIFDINDRHVALKNTKIELANSSLAIDSIGIALNGLNSLSQAIKEQPIALRIDGARITPSDLAGFVPQLRALDSPFELTLHATGNAQNVQVDKLTLASRNRNIDIAIRGRADHDASSGELTFDVPQLDVTAHTGDALALISAFTSPKPNVRSMLEAAQKVRLDGSAHGSLRKITFNGDIFTALGNVDVNATFANLNTHRKGIKGKVSTTAFNLGKMLNKESLLGSLALNADVDLHLDSKTVQGMVVGNLPYFELKGYRYSDGQVDVELAENSIDGHVRVDDPNCSLQVDGYALRAAQESIIDANIAATGVNLAALNLYQKNADKNLTFEANVSFTGDKPDNANGALLVKDFAFVNAEGEGLRLESLQIDAKNDSVPQRITLASDFFNGTIEGSYDFMHVVPTLQNILAQALPALVSKCPESPEQLRANDFTFDFELEPCEDLVSLLKLPVNIVYTTTIKGYVNERDESFGVDISAPYLQQGNKIIESTSVTARKLPEKKDVELLASTIFPVKKGKTVVTVEGKGVDDTVDLDLAWKILTDRDYKGKLSLTSRFFRNVDEKVAVNVDVNPTELVFNDTIWQVKPGQVQYDGGIIAVRNLQGISGEQSVLIDGIVSKNQEDVLKVELNELSLDYIFETLAIDNVMFGGTATGKFYASNLLSGAPILETPNLHVENIAYNKCRMGNADIKSNWDNETKGINLYANIAQDNGLTSIIEGAIYPTCDSLSINFDAHRAKIGFLQPFMQAITSDITGEVSGKACLYGDFHNINLYGDIFADELRFKVDYTNVYYTASDSVHIVPGYIAFDNITIRDRDGRTAKVNGWLKHDYFHRPEFDFSITEADNLLCYDVTPAISPDWYGTIYGNGSAFVKGGPGICEIGVNMETRDRSRFTFVLSDNIAATEYNFITFVDRNKTNEEEDDGIPQIVKELTAKNIKNNESAPSIFRIDIQADITNVAQLTVVMDPVGGDKIRGNGRGNMRLTYDSSDESLGMYGKYELEKGSYNFTLQDIIIKDFTINSGSNISFNGDPYSANLDIKAAYSLNANLLDLDESFASDRELNRTNVPVNAILMARGDMRQPDISFDLEFPTISTEAERKVKSIISTDDLMNRQILYLLALNRFYTPEYMGNQTRNNELASVASSTLSSQLSNMLGQLSENWSISPNFRSDKGDFSDVEVDLALSSQLLNNRLIFNGNFGYRDNSMNTRNSNFIGDFDIEYLLNRRGTLRLKAYNHFNDQNYYVRSAMTTQGVGVEFKLDFENPFRKPRTVLPAVDDSISKYKNEAADTVR